MVAYVRFGSVPACRGRGWIFNLATCYARPNGRVRPGADISRSFKTHSLRIKLERECIASFVSEKSATPVQLSAAERAVVVQSLNDRLNVDVEAQMPWDAVDAPYGVQTASGWKLVPMFVGTASCLLFSACATSIWRFTNGAELLLFLEASPPFEFYICDEQATYLLCCNDHDFVIGWGRSVEWVRQLKTS